MKRIQAIVGGVHAVVASGSLAMAADLPAKAPAAATIYNWTGFYAGGHVGYGDGSFGPGTNAILDQAVFFPSTPTGLIGGFQAGYNAQLANKFVVGVEADLTFISPIDRPATAPARFNTTLDYVGTVRSRIGYAHGTLLPYVTGGLAWGQTHVDINDEAGNISSKVSRNSALAVPGAQRSNTITSISRARRMGSVTPSCPT